VREPFENPEEGRISPRTFVRSPKTLFR